MKKIKLLFCGLIALAFAFTSCASNDLEVSSYIRTWPLGSTPEQIDEGKHWTADDVKGEYLTELMVAFAHVDPTTWGIKFPDADDGKFPELWDEVAKLQAKYPNMKMHLSVGGFGADDFSPMAADPEKRTEFIDSIVNIVIEKDLDGIDLDWEYPIGPDWGQNIKSDPKDGENFIALLQELNGAFDAIKDKYGKDVSLSIAAPAGPWYVQKLDVATIASLVDTIKLMTYDYYGGWSGTTGHAANLYLTPADADPWGGISTDTVVNNYLNAGVPAEKLILGIPFYGRGWTGVEPGPNGDGLFQPFKESAFGDGLSWSDAEAVYNEGNYTVYWDDVAKATYMYDGNNFITFVDPAAIEVIANYALEKGLGGVMVWEYGHDYKCELFPVLYDAIMK